MDNSSTGTRYMYLVRQRILQTIFGNVACPRQTQVAHAELEYLVRSRCSQSTAVWNHCTQCAEKRMEMPLCAFLQAASFRDVHCGQCRPRGKCHNVLTTRRRPFAGDLTLISCNQIFTRGGCPTRSIKRMPHVVLYSYMFSEHCAVLFC